MIVKLTVQIQRFGTALEIAMLICNLWFRGRRMNSLICTTGSWLGWALRNSRPKVMMLGHQNQVVATWECYAMSRMTVLTKKDARNWFSKSSVPTPQRSIADFDAACIKYISAFQSNWRSWRVFWLQILKVCMFLFEKKLTWIWSRLQFVFCKTRHLLLFFRMKVKRYQRHLPEEYRSRKQHTLLALLMTKEITINDPTNPIVHPWFISHHSSGPLVHWYVTYIIHVVLLGALASPARTRSFQSNQSNQNNIK